MSSLFKEDLLSLKSKLENIETQLEGQMKDLEVREDKWTKMDEQVKDIIKNENEIVRFSVGGKKFATRTDTLLSVKDTLFYKIILSNKFNLKDEIFFDRSPKIFPYILDYLRYKKINYKRFNKEELEELKIESEYYEVGDMFTTLEMDLKEVDFVAFETNGVYSYNNQTAGTNMVEDLKNKSLMTGICAVSPGWIVIELNKEWEFDEIEVAGWNGNTTLWGATNGSGATILTSNDKSTWKTVGTLPTNFGGTISTVKLTKSSGKYIKFNSNSYLGLGYLNIKKN